MLQLLRNFTLLGVLCLWAASTCAHGPIHEKIEQVTKRIEKNPTDPNLYVERAGYFLKDGNFDKSFADYQTARNIDATLVSLDFLVAELFYEFEHYHSALSSISAFQKLEKNIAQCYLLKAKIFDKLFTADSALYYAEAAYPHLTKPSTHYFITVKEYVLFDDKTNYERASKWLIEGKKRMPYDLVIQEEYVNLAMSFSDYDKAEALCQEKLGTLKRKEYWYFLLAKAQVKSEKKEDALISLAKAEKAIERLPRHHKNTSYIKTLRSDILKQKEQLNS